MRPPATNVRGRILVVKSPSGNGSRSTPDAESEAAAIVTKVTVGQYVKLQVWTMLCLLPFSTPGWRTEGGPRSSRHAAITRHLHLAAGACGTKLFGRRLCRLGLIDPPVPRNSCPA